MKNKVVYIHRKKTDREVFYVGMGNPDRPYQKSPTARSIFWHRVVDKYGYDVEILYTGLSKYEAYAIEMEMIRQYGRRDLGTGTLVNLTNGGDGGEGVSCYNTITFEPYSSIGEAAQDIGVPQTTISSDINSKKDRYPIRRMDDNRPNGDNETDYLTDENNTIPMCECPEFDDDEMALLNKIDSLPQEDVDILMMSYSMSVRQISDKSGIGRASVDRKLKKIREQILGDDIHLYNNKSLKHLKC